MGQFKPMVKMQTTEPSVELKLKTGGSATHKRAQKEGAPVRKMDGGVMGALAGRSPITPPMGNPAAARAMAAKKMMRRPPAMPPAPPMQAMPPMKKGGEVETPAMHKAEMGAIKKVDKKLTKHAASPASKAHKGLKTGGVMKSTKPAEYKTGGVVNGQAGFKSGGIIKTMNRKTTKVVEARPDTNSAPTGDVKLGNAGGYKKGGAAKKHFATGGAVNNSGHAVAMPKKAPSKPVAISQLSGTFKRGGRVKNEEC
jgi:hypothetical protein